MAQPPCEIEKKLTKWSSYLCIRNLQQPCAILLWFLEVEKEHMIKGNKKKSKDENLGGHANHFSQEVTKKAARKASKYKKDDFRKYVPLKMKKLQLIHCLSFKKMLIATLLCKF